MSAGGSAWRRCSSCKQSIGHGNIYWVCSVSTCNRKRTGLVFCSTECWDSHLGIVPHRESWAVEKRAPQPGAEGSPAKSPASPERAPRRRIVRAEGAGRTASGDAGSGGDDIPREVLIVASKLKNYVRARSGMNTSDRVLEVLSDEVRRLADKAIASARRAERKTILDRDFGS